MGFVLVYIRVLFLDIVNNAGGAHNCAADKNGAGNEDSSIVFVLVIGISQTSLS